MPVTFTNNTATPIGLWDTSPEYHVVGMGQSVTIEPDTISTEVIKIYAESGSGTVTEMEAPENTGAPTISGDAMVGETLTANPGTWSGRPAPTFEYQWLADDSEIDGADGDTYIPVEGDIGDEITVAVTGTNAAGSDTATSAATDPVVAALSEPENESVPTLSGDAVVGETVTSTTGNWTGSPTPDYTRQWQRSSNGTSGWSNISGETGTSYDLDEADEGQYVRVQVTATNSEGSNTANSAALGPIGADEG